MLYHKPFISITYAFVCASLVSCATYVSQPSPNSARIKFTSENCNGCNVFVDQKNTCWPDSSIRVSSDDYDGIYVEPGKRMWVSWLTAGGFQVMTTCRVAISFIPEPNVTYVSHFQRDICSWSNVTIYRVDANGNKKEEPTSSQEGNKGICDF